MQIVGLLGLFFDAEVVSITNSLLLPIQIGSGHTVGKQFMTASVTHDSSIMKSLIQRYLWS